ncbi:hypothetical protein CANTEDRAFT_116375 [Yamadazyma tenuis ATCC 10573]|nr:uncharacterized protein CANTEDRAFT_116375 [Yamadazyma tenuis ATCC 10573]EGV60320.1 hypothetical protein CANTEDRAFT_116375 [Yamadazyma tenuis ATCC 10573]
MNFKPIIGQNIDTDPRHSFWTDVFNIIEGGSINITQGDISTAVQYVDKSQQQEGPNSKSVLLSKAYISPETTRELTMKHNFVMSTLPRKLHKSTYVKGANGIVIIGGQKFSWLSYLSLVALRKSGSNIPVEIVMPQHEDFVQEQEFCQKTLPKLNARCVVLAESLGAEVMFKWSSNFANYQLKSLALMVSSFQNVLLLDSDNILVQNPDSLFTSKLFKDYGMVTWPDYWERTISPVFYDISGLKVNEDKRVRYNRFPLATPDGLTSNLNTRESIADEVPYHDLEGAIPNLSTESGQVLINKDTHACTLLLSMYYNMLGPNLYYKLFSLGEQGEGDKDTFPAAASVCGENFYQVKSFIRTFGYFDDGGNFQGVAMGQKDPLGDYEKYQKYLETPSKSKENKHIPIKSQIENIDNLQKEHFSGDSGKLFAIHCNFPKFDPVGLLAREDLWDAENKRLKYRLFSGFTYDDPNIKAKTLDFELEQWKNIEKALCSETIDFPYFKSENIEEICTLARNQVRFLQSVP